MLTSIKRSMMNHIARMRTAHRLRQHRLRAFYRKSKSQYEALTRQQKIALAVSVAVGLPVSWALFICLHRAERYAPQLAQWLNTQWGLQVTPMSLLPIIDTAVFAVILPLPLLLGLSVRWVRLRLKRLDARL